MTRKVAGSIIALSALLLALSSSSALAEVYKWTDENGVTHYTQTPPPSGQDAELQDVPEYEGEAELSPPTEDESSDPGAETLSAADLKRQELAAARKENAEEKAATEALCQDTQQRLAQLEPSRRVFYTNEEGETARMDDEQRVAEIQRLKEIQSSRCQ
ncbi:MAG TPA: DUF4124 domain-containing protein [Anaerolineales bacterium]|nr:DUF4124 domain-containing protein [Anaerolineales bacterium]